MSTVDEVGEHAGLLSAAEACSSVAAELFDAMPDRADDEGNTETAVAGGEDLIGDLPEDVLSSGAANLFDAMSDNPDDEGNTETPVAGSEDRIDALQDNVLRFLLSFLPSRGAVQTSGTANLFDAVSDRAVGEGNTETAVAGGEDRISALPDDVLRYLMPFLLSREAVRTCVLAKRWRTLWKSVPALRIEDPESYGGATGSSTFVDELLRLRDPTPLNVCIISSECREVVDDESDWDADEAFEHMEPWLQYVVSCEVKQLTVYFPMRVTNMALISSHLKSLVFCRIRFEGGSLDFSSCHVLEELRMYLGDIFTDICSQSLKYLFIDGSAFKWDTRTHIIAPNLVEFRLGVYGGLTPFIDSMPSLVTASVTIGEWCLDSCGCNNHSCDKCHGEAGGINRSLVLSGLSGATNLNLTIDDPNVFIFRKDLKWCPMFSKLKTLLLNQWCLVDNFKGLLYFLQHSPILQTLTICIEYQPHKQQLVFKTDESYSERKQLLLSKHLKLVTILCERREDVAVPHILKILSAHGVPSEQIVIQSVDEED